VPALRLVLTAGPPTLVFDEVDAGIGGEAALAVGRSLAALGATHQVLVVTHLPQVAAFAHNHVGVRKVVRGDATYAEAVPTTGDERLVELSRMLSGSPDSDIAKEHAAELLAMASVAATPGPAPKKPRKAAKKR
jgi:DNA repair protein RecN (Recombination protein N)